MWNSDAAFNLCEWGHPSEITDVTPLLRLERLAFYPAEKNNVVHQDWAGLSTNILSFSFSPSPVCTSSHLSKTKDSIIFNLHESFQMLMFTSLGLFWV